MAAGAVCGSMILSNGGSALQLAGSVMARDCTSSCAMDMSAASFVGGGARLVPTCGRRLASRRSSSVIGDAAMVATSSYMAGNTAFVVMAQRQSASPSPSSSSSSQWSMEKGFGNAASSPFGSSGGTGGLAGSGTWRISSAVVTSELASGGDDGGVVGGGSSGGGGGGGDESSSEEGGEGGGGKAEAVAIMAAVGRKVDSLPADLAGAIAAGRIPASIIKKYLAMEKSPLLRWLMQFAGFRERLLADDLFLSKMLFECGIGICTKSIAEYERRRERFMKELDFVFADIVMAIIADFMLVWLPAPTIALRGPMAKGANGIAKFFFNCPDNAFQIALNGASYSLVQRCGAVVRNGAKLFVVGTGASLIGTAATNGLKAVRRLANPSAINTDEPDEDVPILGTSAAYGAYMAVSSNLRYQVLAGVVEQRILEPLLHQHRLALSLSSFAVRTANTFVGSLLWVDYAIWVGVQKVRE